jgi:hypothetical protein
MIRLRGRRAGEKLIPRQYANDWISVDTSDGRPEIVSPVAVQLDPEDFALFTDADPQRVGTFWREWRLCPDGRFRRNRLTRPRS